VIFDLFDDLNWAAVIVAAVAYFALGWLWYSNALFGRQYRAAIGKEEASDVVDVGAIVANLAGWFIAAVALALVSAAVGADSVLDGLVLGLVVSFGFIGTNRIVANLAGWFIAAVALALVSAAVGADSVLDGLVLGLVVSFGFIGTNRIVASFYETRNSALMAVNAPYTLLGYVIMGVILAVWT